MGPKKFAQRRSPKEDLPGLAVEGALPAPVNQAELLAQFRAKNNFGGGSGGATGGSAAPVATITQSEPSKFPVVHEEDDDENDDGDGGWSRSTLPVEPTAGGTTTTTTVASPQQSTTTESTTETMASRTSGGGAAGGFLNCDLCNGEVKGCMTLEEHVVKCHPDLTIWCEQLLMDKPGMSKKVVSANTSLTLGRKAKDLAVMLDKGPKSFACAVEGTKQLTLIAQQKFRTCSAFMFGSCVALGIWDGDGDVDMTIVDPKGWLANPQTWPGDESGIVMKLTRCLRESGFAYQDLEPVRHTRVPIVKHASTLKAEKWRLGDKRCNQVHIQLDNGAKLTAADRTKISNSIKGNGARMIEWEKGYRIIVQCPDGTDAVAARTEPIIGLPPGCRERYRVFPNGHFKPAIFYMDFDVSSRAHGVRNSYLLRGYFQQHHTFRAGSIFVKKWSKASGVNNSRKGYLTSYAVNLLWLHYLVRKGQASFFNPTDIPILPDHPTKDLTYMPIFPKEDSLEEEKNLGDLLVGFFRFYAIEFDWEKDVVTLNQPELKHKAGDLQWTEANETHAELFRNRVWYRLCIEDPYEPNLNLGRHVSPVKLKKLMAEFLFGYDQLLQGTIGGLLHDRSSDKVKERMGFNIRKAMVGYEERPHAEVVAELSEMDLPSWAAFQVEHKATKIFEMAEFKYLDGDQVEEVMGRNSKSGGKKGKKTQNGVEEDQHDEAGDKETDEETLSGTAPPQAMIVHRRAEMSFIETKALPSIRAIEETLAKKPILGVPLTDEYRHLFLDCLFVCDQESDRLFLENSHVEQFYHHKSVVDAIMRDELSYPLTTLGKEAKKRWSKCDVEVIEAVVYSFKTYHVDDGLVKLATSSNQTVLGDCADCKKRKVKVWGEHAGATLMYCASCWADYERK